MDKITRRTALKAAGASGLVLSGMGVASAETGGGVAKQLAELRQATKQYHDLETAEADGYVLDDHCVAHPGGAGAMGYHAGNLGKVDDKTDHTDPEVLVYEKRGGEFHLVAAEFLVVGAEAPTLFDQEMHLFIPADDPINPFEENIWALHAWVWKGNPNGVFAHFNPNVSCPVQEE